MPFVPYAESKLTASYPKGRERGRPRGVGAASRWQVYTAVSPTGAFLALSSMQMLEEMRNVSQIS